MTKKKSPPVSAALIVYTGSAGTLPNHVSKKKILTRSQKWNWRKGQREVDGAAPRVFERAGRAKSAMIAAARTITPPSLCGTARRSAYTHRKYHSGLMWAGVTRGSAGMKLSGSAKRSGARKFNAIKRVKVIKIPRTSFTV